MAHWAAAPRGRCAPTTSARRTERHCCGCGSTSPTTWPPTPAAATRRSAGLRLRLEPVEGCPHAREVLLFAISDAGGCSTDDHHRRAAPVLPGLGHGAPGALGRHPIAPAGDRQVEDRRDVEHELSARFGDRNPALGAPAAGADSVVALEP